MPKLDYSSFGVGGGKATGKPLDYSAFGSKPVQPAPPPTPPTTMAPGYGASVWSDPYSGKPLLTYRNEQLQASQFLSDRTAPSFDFSKPQKITREMLTNGRMPESVSQGIRQQVGAKAKDELDHVMPLELGGSNLGENLRLGGVDTAKENEITRRALNGEISVLDAWKEMADYKGVKLAETPKFEGEKISAAPVPSTFDKYYGKVRDLLMSPGQVDIKAKAMNDYYLETHPNAPKPSNIQQILNEIDTQGPIEKGISTLVIGSIIADPAVAIPSILKFMALDTVAKGAVSMITQKNVQNFSDVIPAGSPQVAKDLIDVLTFIGEGFAVHGLNKLPIAEKLTKNILTEYHLPKEVFIEGPKIKSIFQTGKEISPEESQMVRDLGLDAKGYKDAINNGLRIAVPAEKIVTVTDKPYWAKLKSVIGLESTPEVSRTLAGEAKQAPTGLLEEGKPPAEVPPAPPAPAPFPIPVQPVTPEAPIPAPAEAPKPLDYGKFGKKQPKKVTFDEGIPASLRIPPDVEEKANADWEENFAETAQKIYDRTAELRDQLKKKGVAKEERISMEKEIKSLDDSYAKMENDFVEKWRAEAQKVSEPKKPAVDPLLSEARKYKTAEEFVRAQGETVYRSGTPREGIGWFASEKDVAKSFGKNVQEYSIKPKNPLILDTVNDVKKIIPLSKEDAIWFRNDEALKNKVVEYAKKNNYDAVLMPDSDAIGNPTKNWVAIDKSILQTKSQLTKIWEKAHKGTARLQEKPEKLPKKSAVPKKPELPAVAEEGEISVPAKAIAFNRTFPENLITLPGSWGNQYFQVRGQLPDEIAKKNLKAKPALKEQGSFDELLKRFDAKIEKLYPAKALEIGVEKTDVPAVRFSINGQNVLVNRDYLNPIKKYYPDAKLFGVDDSHPILAKVGDEVVGVVMPIQNGELKPPVLPKTPSGTAMGMRVKSEEPLPVKEGTLPAGRVVPFEFPEMVELARNLIGNAPEVLKSMGHALGRFRFTKLGPVSNGDEKIQLRASLFRRGNEEMLAQVLAHEIGHLIDYIPDKRLDRGNILGRLLTLRNFMNDIFGSEGAIDKEKLRLDALEEVKKELRSGKDVSNFNEAVEKRLNEKITAEGGIRNKMVRDELLKVTQRLNPYDRDVLSKSYVRYRESSKELYAEAMSMLLNSPGMAEEMAPTFYNTFFENLDKKPAVREAFFDLQAIVSGDREALIKHRREGIQKMFEAGDYKAAEYEKTKIEEKKKRDSDVLFRLRYELVDNNMAFVSRVTELKKRGVVIPDDDNPIHYLNERNYLGGKIKALFQENVQPIYNDLKNGGVDWHIFGEQLFYDRIISGDRSDIANPRGISPKVAEELKNNLRENLTADQQKLLDGAISRFREFIRSVAQEAFDEGLYSPDLHKEMLKNPSYVTFQVLDHIEDGMNSKIYHQMGTLKDVVNPADSSLLKIISTLRAIERNKVSRQSIKFLQDFFPADIKEAKSVFTGKVRRPIESNKPGEELVMYREEGKLKGFYVDKYISTSLNNESIGRNLMVLRVLRFLNGKLFRPLFITYNPGFQAFNFYRDLFRFWKNVPNMTMFEALKLYKKSLPAARVRAFGLPAKPTLAQKAAGELVTKLEKEQLLSTTFNDIRDGETIEDRQIDEILKKTGIPTFAPGKETASQRILRVTKIKPMLDFIENMGNLIETLPKIAGYFELKDKMPPREMRDYIRKNIGSPDFLAGGHIKPWSNELFFFSNAITQGIRADYNVATDPRTASGFWWKTVKLNLIPKILMIAAGIGLFGASAKEEMDGASEYDKANYTIVPLGRDQNGKSVYIRVPQDETGRLIGGILWKILNSPNNKQGAMKDIADIGSFMGGQAPNITPVITAGLAAQQFVAGQNPYDFFRGRNVLTDLEFKAGGKQAFEPFISWMFQELGGGVFMKMYNESTPTTKTTGEKILNLPVLSNIAGRFLKISDFGKSEQLRQTSEQIQSEKARKTLRERELLNQRLRNYQRNPSEAALKSEFAALLKDVFGHLPATKEENDAANLLAKKFAVAIERGKSDPNVNALISAVSNAEKVALILEMKQGLSKDEFRGVLETALKNKIISTAVLNEVAAELKK